MSHDAETKQYVQGVIHATRNKLVAIKSSIGRYRKERDDNMLDKVQDAIEQLFAFLSQLAAEMRQPDDDAIDTTPSES